MYNTVNHHVAPLHPVAVSVISCSEDSQRLRAPVQNLRMNGTGSVRTNSPTSNSKFAIQWEDCLFAKDDGDNNNTNNKQQQNLLLSALPPDAHCPIEPFSNLCNLFTQIVPFTDKVARHYFDATAPATAAIVQAKQPIFVAAKDTEAQSTNFNRAAAFTGNGGDNSSTTEINPGDSCWCIAVLMPPRHTASGIQRNRPNHSISPASDIVHINLCLFVYHQEAVQLMDSVMASCVAAARNIDSALSASSSNNNTNNNNNARLMTVNNASSTEILNHLVNVTKSIPRDLASFLPMLADSWAGALRPPHAMIPLAHFVQIFDYPVLMPLFSLLCQGASVVFTHSSPAVASQCCIAARGLLYPFAWPHHFVPLVTSTECWPFPLMKSVESHSTAFLAGICASDLPALLIDHSKTPQPCELWIADCTTGTVTRAAPQIYSSRFSIHHPRIVNLSLPSNILLKDCWEKSKTNMLRQTGSPKEHLRMSPDARSEILNCVAGYWAESMIGQYRLALQPPREIFEWDRFFYKFLTTTSLSPAGLDADPDGTIRTLAMILKQTDMFSKAFVQSIFSMEQLTHLRMKNQETSFVPFWKWGLGSVSAGKRTVRNKEHHDYYFFFRKCCEKFPNLYQDDAETAQKSKKSSGFFDKIGDALNRAKDSVRNSISDLSLDRHFSLTVPYVSRPQSGFLPMMLKKSSDENASSPRFLGAVDYSANAIQYQNATSGNVGLNVINNSGSGNNSQQQNNNNNNHQQQMYLQSTIMNNQQYEASRIEAQARFFPVYLRREHWSLYYPHAKDYSIKYDRRQRETMMMNYEPVCTPLPLDVLCDFGSYHSLLAPPNAIAGSLNEQQAQQSTTTPAPNQLLKISLPGNKQIELANNNNNNNIESQNNNSNNTLTREGDNQNQNQEQSSPATLFNKISLPNGSGVSSKSTSPANNTIPVDSSAPTRTPPVQSPVSSTQQQQQQPASSSQMNSLFGPTEAELEEQRRREQQANGKPKLDDFFG